MNKVIVNQLDRIIELEIQDENPQLLDDELSDVLSDSSLVEPAVKELIKYLESLI